MKHDLYSKPGAKKNRALSYTEWGDAQSSHKIFCVHGLTRNSRDFDFLARELVNSPNPPHIICPDMAGRGQSDWLDNPEEYNNQTYLMDCLDLIRHLDWSELDWVGTSMGGIIGMSLAAMPENPVRTLVLNDIGPFIPKAALMRIAAYLGSKPLIFNTLKEAENHLRFIHASFGNLTDREWQHLAKYGTRTIDNPAGALMMHYDPTIGQAFTQNIDDIEFWPVWQAITADVVLLRGENSDILLEKTVRKMKSSKEKLRFHEFANVGHAPALMSLDQINVIKNALLIKSM